MENGTKQNILRKKKIKSRRRRLKIGRVLVFFLLIGFVAGAAGWGVYHIYQWGSGAYASLHLLYEDHQRQEEVRKSLYDPRMENYINFLFMGLDTEANSTPPQMDAAVFVSLNKATGELRLLNIPRKTLVRGSAQEVVPLSALYTSGGTQAVQQAVSGLLKIPVKEYVILDLETMRLLLDKMQGIDLYVEEPMDYEDPAGGIEIHLKRGYQHLDGEAAAGYVRFCSDDMGDLGREYRQQNFLKAFYGKILQPETLQNAVPLYEILSQRVISNMEPGRAELFWAAFKTLRSGKVSEVVLPGQTEPGSLVWKPDASLLEQQMQEWFPEFEIAGQ